MQDLRSILSVLHRWSETTCRRWDILEIGDDETVCLHLLHEDTEELEGLEYDEKPDLAHMGEEAVLPGVQHRHDEEHQDPDNQRAIDETGAHGQAHARGSPEACRRGDALDLLETVEHDGARADETDAADHLGAQTGKVGVPVSHIVLQELARHHGKRRTKGNDDIGADTGPPALGGPLPPQGSREKHHEQEPERNIERGERCHVQLDKRINCSLIHSTHLLPDAKQRHPSDIRLYEFIILHRIPKVSRKTKKNAGWTHPPRTHIRDAFPYRL